MSARTRNILTAAILLTGIAFVVIGVMRDEISVVLRKAVNVCLECIGLG